MMKKFFLIVCGSFVGVWVALTVFFFTTIVFSFVMLGMMGASSSSTPSVSKHSVLYVDLSGVIDERSSNGNMDMVAMLQGSTVKTTGLNTLIAAIGRAQVDDKVDGIFINCEGVQAAPATLKALRRALVEFKKNSEDKFVYAYAHEGYAQGDYYVASMADSVFLNPVGAVDVHGLASATLYPKKLLDKVGVEMQVIRVGTFKSAVEPYMVEEMSEANRMQQEVYLGNIWKDMSAEMAQSRNIDSTAFNALVDGVVVCLKGDSLVSNKLVDRLVYPHELEARLKELTDVDPDDDINFVDPETLAPNLDEAKNGDKVAVLYAVGEIDGAASYMGGSQGIVSDDVVDIVRELIDDDDVKALVLRVNSPGGSAFGSEQMWKALDDFKKSGKPLVVSMGDYAASGGYYMSCGADYIFAEPTTITGSIGIFGVIPCTQDLVENKLGVNTEVVKTNENADMGVTTKRLTPVQQAALQNMINAGYDLFTRRCADGRHVTQDSIKVIAEGRVWDGASALQIGLVDKLGGLDDAIKWAAQKAGIKKYETQNYPTPVNEWERFLSDYMAQQYEARLQGEMGMLYDYHKQLMQLLGRDHVLCIMEKPVIY